MFLELKSDNDYKEAYFEMLKYRLAHASLELEGIDDDLATTDQSWKIYNQLSAINYVFNPKNNHSFCMNHMEFTSFVCEIATIVSGGEISDFRKTRAEVNGSIVPRSKASMVRNNLWYLIDDYNYQIKNAKSEDELFEIEALFHIRLLHIHPFEDANGRTARILLTYNLAKNDLAPCIITKTMKDEYCNYIENSDYKSLALMFKNLSHLELSNMLTLYKQLDSKGYIETNLMNDEQEKEYKKVLKKL